jgi:RNA polymerase sigma-70 factor (ECF subfamily)
MKSRTVSVIVVAGVLCGFTSQVVRGQDVDSAPPVVIKTVPEAGTKTVPAGDFQIKITFSKRMQDRSWSWASAWQDSTPKALGAPRYDTQRKTCVLKVKLEPNKTYGYWLNSENFQNFKDAQGRPAVPYLLVFKTGAKAATEESESTSTKPETTTE